MELDVVVVGAGSAGCVLAARLSEDPGRSVVLLEAGPDYTADGSWPAELIDAATMPAVHDWGYVDAPPPPGWSRPLGLQRGKLVGGSSAVNYCIALRTRPADHHAWAAQGLPRWSWEEVLPFYRELEDDPEGDARWHGAGGPVPIERGGADGLTESQRAFLAACQSDGHKLVTDFNAPTAAGAGIAPLNQRDGRRQSAALTHLKPALDRPNLQLRADTEVHSVLVEDGRAVGVRLGSGEELRARQVVLCAGSYSSPAILQRSGIGPADHLRELGITVVRDLPGVGSGLVEHPAYRTVFAVRPGDHPDQQWRTMLSLRSTPDAPDVDLHIQARSALPTASRKAHPTGYDMVLLVGLLQPRSAGSVRLASPDLADLPVIDLGFYRDRQDARAVADGVRTIRRLAQSPALAELFAEELRPGPAVADDELEDAVRAFPAIYNHPVGSCRMGPADRPGAVVDEQCRVHGVDGLLVVDASVMPVSPRATTHLPVLMLAERATALNWPVSRP
ncbi:GMC family oxidoreductase [Kitasatospora sp. NPDC003701]